MNSDTTELWDKIKLYDFDYPEQEYGFSTRLAYENSWTIYFTKQAILEYKKFMYLAATCNQLVSPSEIVDIVWHQHLLFTKDYADFCKVLGKNIQHIPSTHNPEETEIFQKAKENTRKLYEENFGKQLKEYWVYDNIWFTLGKEVSPISIERIFLLGIIGFIVVSAPLYFLIKPFYYQINTPNFLIGYTFLFLVTLLFLEFYNRSKNRKLFIENKNEIFKNFTPNELIYMKKRELSHIITGYTNNLFIKQNLLITKTNRIEINKSETTNDTTFIEKIILSNIGLYPTHYATLLRKIIRKPIFSQIEKSIRGLITAIHHSKSFIKRFATNLFLLLFILELGIIRVATGLNHNKGIGFLLILIITLGFISFFYLRRQLFTLTSNIIPEIYKTERFTNTEYTDQYETWECNYFVYGSALLYANFSPLAVYVEANRSTGSSCGSGCGGNSCNGDSGGSSCGSSCGSGCGGCGGGD